MRFVVGRSESQSSADLQCAAAGRHGSRRRRGEGGTGVPVVLARVGTTRHRRPRQRVELCRLKAKYVAGTHCDQLVCHQRQLLEAKFGRPKKHLTYQRVVVQRGRRRIVMMMMMLRMMTTDATVESVHRPPHLHRCTNNAITVLITIHSVHVNKVPLIFYCNFYKYMDGYS